MSLVKATLSYRYLSMTSLFTFSVLFYSRRDSRTAIISAV